MPYIFKRKPLLAAIMAFSLPATALAADEKELDVIKVTSAAGFEQNITDAPASISVISGEELNKKSYTNVLDAIKNIPGVYMTGGGGMGDISVRGMSAGYTMYLVDGRPISSGRSVNSNGTDGGKQVGLPPISMIERVEVIRGPMSSLYGSDAMGGIINIITKKTTGEWTGSINTEWTHSLNDINNDEQKVDLMTGGALVEGLLGLQVTGSWIGTDESDFNANSTKSDASTPEGKNREIGGKLIFTPDANNDIALSYNKAIREYTHTPGKSKDLYKKDRKGKIELDAKGEPIKDDSSFTQYEKDIYSLTHDGRYGNLMLWSYLQHDISENVSTEANSQKKESQTIFNTQGTTYLGAHALTFGGQYRKEKIINEQNGLLDINGSGAERTMDRWLAALYTEVEWNITQDLALTTGLRYNDDEFFGSHWSPRVYGVYHLTDTFTLKGGVSTGYKQPSLGQATEGFGQTTGGGNSPNKDNNGNDISRALIIGNENLTPETSVSYEFGYVFDQPSLGLNTSLMLFHTEFDDKISEDRYCTSDQATDNNDVSNYSCQYGQNTYYFLSTYKNIDKASMQGVEFTLDYAITDEVKFSTSYTFTESEQKSGQFKGEPLNKMPKHMANANLDWKASDALTTWAQYNYRGKTSEYLSRTSMSDGTPGYGFVDLGLAYKVNPRATAKFGIYNVLNKEVTNEDYGVVLDGRRVNVGLSVNF